MVAMATDEGPSRLAALTARIGWSRGQSDVYRNRLLRAGMIKSLGNGSLGFAVPGLREYLINNAELLVGK